MDMGTDMRTSVGIHARTNMWHDIGKGVETDMRTDMQMGMGTEMETDMEIDKGTSAEVRGAWCCGWSFWGFWGCTTMHAWACVDVHRHADIMLFVLHRLHEKPAIPE